MARLAPGPARRLSFAPESPLARIAIIVRPEALERVLEACAPLLGAGHAVHLALTEPEADKRLASLWKQQPGLEIGYAIPRRDRWHRLADRLDLAARRRLPPDPGVRAYLAQLDLDLLLLAAAEPGPLETDYLAASAHLRLPAVTLAATPEEVLAQAAPGLHAPARVEAAPPDLWARLIWHELTEVPEPVESDSQGQTLGLAARLQESYARQVFPALGAAVAAVAPARRSLLKGSLKERLRTSALADETFAEAAMTAAAESQGVVVLGPWWGDADQELLYWTPFVSWWRRRYRVDRERIVAVSSGHAAPWYEGIAGRYIDLAELYDAETLAGIDQARRQELASRDKRYGGAEADREVLKRLNRRLGFRGVTAVPPWAMAVMLDRYWSGQAGPSVLAARTRPQPLKVKTKWARNMFEGLPERYIALGLGGESNPERRKLIEQLALRIGRNHAVVILAEPKDDAFAEALTAQATMLQMIELEVGTRKETATALLAASSGYIGPAGWMAYAAASLNRPTVCLTSGAEPRDLIDRAAATQLMARAPLFIDLAETEIAAVAVTRLAAPAD